MTLADVINLHRFVGLVEGVVLSLPTDTQNLVYDYLDCVSRILDDELQDKVNNRCTGERCPMQTGYDVANCKNKNCSCRTTEKGADEK